MGATVFHLFRTPVAAASAKMPSELKQKAHRDPTNFSGRGIPNPGRAFHVFPDLVHQHLAH
jgi:hypothetical protein